MTLGAVSHDYPAEDVTDLLAAGEQMALALELNGPGDLGPAAEAACSDFFLEVIRLDPSIEEFLPHIMLQVVETRPRLGLVPDPLK